MLNWSKVLEFWKSAIQEMSNKEHGRVLCLGERDGGISLWFALQGYTVVCSDIHETTNEAINLHDRYNVKNNITYEAIDIYRIPYPDNYFDMVACKSVIGGLKLNNKDASTRSLENQKHAVDEIRRVLKQDGFFLGAENMQGSLIHHWIRKLKKGEKIGWRHLQLREVEWLFNSFKDVKYKPFGFVGTFYKYNFLNTIFSRIDRILSAVLKRDWLYITFISARK